MDITTGSFNAICKAIDYYKVGCNFNELIQKLPPDAKKVFEDADIAIAETKLKRKAAIERMAKTVQKHREEDPWYGQHKRRDARAKKTEE